MEKKRLIAKQYEVDLFCDECGGQMYSDYFAIDKYLLEHSYHCCDCGNRIISTKCYPHTVSEKI